MNKLDATRTTLLSLIPATLSEAKKRALATEIERADLSKKATLEALIATVGIDNFAKASGGVVQEGEKNRSLAKMFCHGGDCALLGGVDLEYEAQINAALFGHSHKRKRVGIDQVFVPDLSISQVEKKIRNLSDLQVPPRFVATVQRGLGLVLMQILHEANRIAQTNSGRRQKKIPITCTHLLTALEVFRWPLKNKWESTLIEKVIQSDKNFPFL